MAALDQAAGFALHFAGGAVIMGVYRRWQRVRGFSTEGMRLVFLAALAGALLGAALLQYVPEATSASFWQRSLHDHLLHLLLGGRTWLGALLGGYLGVELAKRPLGITRSTGDGFALALPLGEAVGRLGCFFAGCCYGLPTTLPWAVWQHGAWRHPTQLYSAAAALALFALMWRIRDRLPREGDLFKLYLFLYAATRFGLEFLRDHGPHEPLLSPAQWLCLAAMGVLAAYAGFRVLSSEFRVNGAAA
jgi:phosphatidylglycerol:prolipoprotein diacylglycerol transferase